jgi:hypothetical protein
MRDSAAYLVIGLSGLLGVGSLVAFTVFLYAGSFGPVSFGLGHKGALWMDAGLSLLFFIQHSGMRSEDRSVNGLPDLFPGSSMRPSTP